MAQYINKDTVVEEIQKIYDSDYKFLPSDIVEGVQNFKDDLLMNLDALEVKEVDLEKQLKEDIEDVFFDLAGVAVKGATSYLTVEDVKDIARHFFELGMVAGNKAQKGE